MKSKKHSTLSSGCLGCLIWVLFLILLIVVAASIPRIFPSLNKSETYRNIMSVTMMVVMLVSMAVMLVWAAVLVCLKIGKIPYVKKKHEENRRMFEEEMENELKTFAALQDKFGKLIDEILGRAGEIHQQIESLRKQSNNQNVEFYRSPWPEPIFERMTRYTNLHRAVLEKIDQIQESARNVIAKMDKVQGDGTGYGTGILWNWRKGDFEQIISTGQDLLDSLSPEKIEKTLSLTKFSPEQERVFAVGAKLQDILSGRIASSVPTGSVLLENAENILWRGTADIWLLRTHTNTIRRPKNGSFVDSFLWNVSAENIEDLASDSRVLSRSQRFNHFGNGVLYCTNQRVIFVGETSTKIIKWKSIVNIECNYEGRELFIHSTSFQKPILFSDVDAEAFDLVQYCARHPEDSTRIAHASTSEVITFLEGTFGKGEGITSIQNAKFLPPEH